MSAEKIAPGVGTLSSRTIRRRLLGAGVAGAVEGGFSPFLLASVCL